MTKADKIRKVYIVVNITKGTIDVVNTKDETANIVGVHRNTIKIGTDVAKIIPIGNSLNKGDMFLVAMRYVEPNKNMKRDNNNLKK